MINFAKKHPILTSAFAGVNLLASVASHQQAFPRTSSIEVPENVNVVWDGTVSSFSGAILPQFCTAHGLTDTGQEHGCADTVLSKLPKSVEFLIRFTGTFPGGFAGGLAGGAMGFLERKM